MASCVNTRLLHFLAALLICCAAFACPVFAQNPSSCTTSGFSGYSFTTTNDGTNTTLHFTFCNRSPMNGIYVNIGEIFFDSMPAPVGTPTAPSGWQFQSIGPKLFYATTSNPWWKTPPAIKPGDCLTGFDYTIPGLVVPNFVVFTHVQNVTDATGQTAGPLGSWFDCSVVITPPEPNPCISVIKTPFPAAGQPGDLITYTYKICNCGDTSLTVTSVSDDVLGNLLANFIAANGGAGLAVGACAEFSVQRNIQASDPDPLVNCVTVIADPPSGPSVSDTECASVHVIKQQPGPCIDLTKTVYPTQAEVGQNVTYSFNVCNCGNVALNVNSMIDNVLGDLLGNFLNANGGSDVLGVGVCVNFDVIFQIPDMPSGPLFNCATVTTTQGVEDTFCARVDVGPKPVRRICRLPVTFTQMGWHTFANPNNPLLPGGILYNRFPIAFGGFWFYGLYCNNEVRVGLPNSHWLAFTGVRFGLDQLSRFFPQTGPVEYYPLVIDYVNPTALLNKQGLPMMNVLAGETLALMLNIGYNDMRVMPRTPGYDLENFTITSGLFKGKKVGYVLNIANQILSGKPSIWFGLPGDAQQAVLELATVIMNINANYEFVGLAAYNDRGYLLPNVPYGGAGPGHLPTVP